MSSTEPATRPSLPKGHDSPIATPAEDRLGALGVARAIYRVIGSAPADWSSRVALLGRWGTGKTSVLNLLRLLESSRGSVVVTLSAWDAVGEAGVLLLFYDSLAAALKTHDIKAPFLSTSKRLAVRAKAAGGFLGNATRRVGGWFGAPDAVSDAVGDLAGSAFEALKISKRDVDELTKRLEGRRVVVLVDDLDRADPKVVPKTLLALRELLDWPGFSFVLAFDHDVVATALSDYSSAYGRKATVFLEKVIDVSFEVPRPTAKQASVLVKDAFSACCDFFPQSVLSALTGNFPSEPRRIKSIARAVGALAGVARRSYPDEVDWHAVLLYSILREANSKLADWIVRASTDERGSWSIWMGDDNEKKDAVERVRRKLTELSSGLDEDELERLTTVATSSLRRWSHEGSSAIEYLVRLVFDEPTFTKKEVDHIIDSWLVHQDDAAIDRAVSQAAEVGAALPVEAARDLLYVSCVAYGDLLQRMSGSETEPDRQSLLGLASERLRFVEHLWSTCAVPAIQEAAKLAESVGTLLGVVATWVGWTRNAGEPALRRRERNLALSAIAGCSDKKALFAKTDPYWGDRKPHADEKVKLMREVRSVLHAALTEELIARLQQPEGLEPIASGDDQPLTWFVESPQSPLYLDAQQASSVVRSLTAEGVSREQSLTLRANAKLFLHMQLFQTRDSSWGGLAELKKKYGLQPKLFEAAWALVAQHPVPFRMLRSVSTLRTDLIQAGVPAEVLATPDWLRQGLETVAEAEPRKDAIPD